MNHLKNIQIMTMFILQSLMYNKIIHCVEMYS